MALLGYIKTKQVNTNLHSPTQKEFYTSLSPQLTKLICDTCESIAYLHLPSVIVANSSSLFSGVTSGLIGLGTNANGANGDFLDTIFGGWFTRNPTHNNFSFGMALQPPTFTSDDDNGNGGILHWVVPDSSAYEGEIAWNDANVAGTAPDTVAGMALDNSYALPESDWTIECEGWVASMGSSAVSNSSKNQVIVEPYFSSINFPLNQANALCKSNRSCSMIHQYNQYFTCRWFYCKCSKVEFSCEWCTSLEYSL